MLPESRFAFFYQDSFGNIMKNIKEHYGRMEIARPEADQLEYLGIWRMLQGDGK